MISSSSIISSLHVITASLKLPAIIVLLVFIVIVTVELGSITVEIIFIRRKMKLNVGDLLAKIQDKNINQIQTIINDSGLLKSQKKAFMELLKNADLSPFTGYALARKLLSNEEMRHHKIVSVTDVIVRLGPMIGLMATLIPLGPGLIALGQGDTRTLADSLLTAFDATVAGLATAGVAFVISRLRKRWYESDMLSIEVIMEGILEEIYKDADEIKEQQSA